MGAFMGIVQISGMPVGIVAWQDGALWDGMAWKRCQEQLHRVDKLGLQNRCFRRASIHGGGVPEHTFDSTSRPLDEELSRTTSPASC